MKPTLYSAVVLSENHVTAVKLLRRSEFRYDPDRSLSLFGAT